MIQKIEVFFTKIQCIAVFILAIILLGGEFLSPISPSLSTAVNRLELLDPTHRGLHR